MQGTVEYVNSRETNYGTMFAYKIGGINYSIGKNKPTANKGDLIAFEATQNAKGYWDAKNVQVLGRTAATQAAATPQAAGAVGSTPRAVARTYMDDERKQGIISKQAARNSAIAATKILQEAGYLPDVAKGKTKGDQSQSILNFIDELTRRYHADALGLDSPASPPDNGEAEAVAAAAADTDWLG